MRAFPAAALIAFVGTTLVYSPALAQECDSFRWGSVGYMQMCIECLRLLTYCIVGYVLPCWCDGSSAFVDVDALGSRPSRKALYAEPSTTNGAQGFTDLSMGLDPGTWALAQCFSSSWHRFCSAPERRGDSGGAPACLRCQQQARDLQSATCFTRSASSLCCAITAIQEESRPVQACLTSAAAPVLLVQSLDAADQAHYGHDDAERDTHDGSATGRDVAVVLYEASARFGTRLHDEAPAEYVQALQTHLGNYAEPSGCQVRKLGSFRAVGASVQALNGGAGADTGQLHASLRAGHWGAGVTPETLQKELAQRQGGQAMVPGPLGSEAAFFVVPALAQSPMLLRAGWNALQQCIQQRTCVDCHH